MFTDKIRLIRRNGPPAGRVLAMQSTTQSGDVKHNGWGAKGAAGSFVAMSRPAVGGIVHPGYA
ncbi:MAG: hypothetical protein AB1705_06415 [Verrucomicrobiota bacterium]